MSTMNSFSYFILLENLFGINRNYLIDSPKIKTLGNIIFFVFSLIFISVGINYVLTSSINFGPGLFQLFLTVVYFDLVVNARARTLSFESLKRLDAKCGTDGRDLAELENRSIKHTFVSTVSAIIDVVGLKLLKFSTSEVIIFATIFSCQDSELIFFSMIVDAINLRLAKLKDVSPSIGSKVYRHLLVTAALINEQFTFRILLLLATILVTTVTYSNVIMLSLTETGTTLLVYLLWREVKTFFCLWKICFASWQTGRICQQLAFHLAKILALEPSMRKDKNPEAYHTISRWYSTILAERPRFISGPILTVDLSVPLHVMDISINYVLIIVQIYVAYK